jgi:SAM-dependent methyltransferase
VSDCALSRHLRQVLVCPRDRSSLQAEQGWLCCSNGHRYRVVEGIPILLLTDTEQTHVEGTRALAVAESGDVSQLPQFQLGPGDIDPFVQNVIGATNGSLYQHLVGKLNEYPIPGLRLPEGKGRVFLEIGCNWGRWCVAAARKGYRPVGIDPSLKGIRAARRVARQLGVEADFLVADGRYLPFADGIADVVFSYSVLQHLSKLNARSVLGEIRRVLHKGGFCQIQLPNVLGIRCLYHQMRRGFRETRDFEVRYWTPWELTSTFRSAIGPARVSVDGYFSLNVQIEDLRFLPRRYRAVVRASEALRKVSLVCRPLVYIADSLCVEAICE